MFHEPVLVEEVLHYLVSDPNGVYLDLTVGGGGHARALLERLSPDARLIGLDRDREALEAAGQRLKQFGDRVTLRQSNFRDFVRVLQELGVERVHGLLLDLGVSSHQIDAPERGFSYSADGALDMRMDRSQTLTAADIVNTYSEAELARLFRDFGEERKARQVARAVVMERKKRRIATTGALAQVVGSRFPPEQRVKSLARVFQALRIAVNDELSSLAATLERALDSLYPGGRLVVISYHSLEDRLVKDFFREQARDCVCPPHVPVCVCGHQARLRILTRRVVRPTPAEVARNPRSRSARLRAAEAL